MQSDIVCSYMAMWIAMYMVNGTLLNCRRDCSYCKNELPVEDLRHLKVLQYHCDAATYVLAMSSQPCYGKCTCNPSSRYTVKTPARCDGKYGVDSLQSLVWHAGLRRGWYAKFLF